MSEREKYMDYLTRDGGMVPCSRWGRNSEECAPVAIRLMGIMEDANGPTDDWRESLEYCMGLVVNDHDDVVSIIRDHGTPEDHRAWFDELGFEESARELGATEGKAAAEWWAQESIGGRVNTVQAIDNAHHVLRGLDEGDPEVLDSLPAADLSMQWAGGKSAKDVARESWFYLDEEHEDTGLLIDALADTYVDAYSNAAVEECERACLAVLEGVRAENAG